MSGFSFDQAVTVERVISQLEGGCIFAGRVDDGKAVRVKFTGKSMQPLAGDTFLIKGQLGSYKDRWGKVTPQVETKVMKRHIQPGELLEPWLKRLPNIGPIRAKRLVETYGHDLSSVLRDITRMADVAHIIEPSKPALAARVAAQMYSDLVTKSSIDRMRVEEIEFLSFLEKIGIKEPRAASMLWRFMAGSDAVARLLKNPYVPAHLMDWGLADRVGQRLLRKSDGQGDLLAHPARLLGGLASVWRQLIGEGDSAAPKQRVRELLVSRNVDPELAIARAEGLKILRCAGNLLRAPGAAWIEDQVTGSIAKMEASPPTIQVPRGNSLDRLIHDGERATELQLTDEQSLALSKLLQLPIGALQGGAGTGKTTVMKVMCYCWERLGGNVVMGALAGKAALQLSRGASSHAYPRVAYTLARLIGMLERQHEQEAGPLCHQLAGNVSFTSKTLLIIDEAGMMDTPTLYRILRLLPAGARLLMAGDDGQLFPIGFGKIFHDIVQEGSRVATLTKVLRQAEDSIIPHVAHQVRSGEFPEIPAWNGETKGVYLVSPNERERVQRSLQAQNECLVIAARRATVSGINESESFAHRTQATPTRRLGPLATVAVGDPVVVTANRYQHGLFNGLLGMVTDIEGENVQVLFDGESHPREIPEEAEADIELAYSITCHKAQGSSADVVMIIVENCPLVSREWLYTGITRSKHLVLLVEEIPGAIQQAIQRRTVRTTGMALGPNFLANGELNVEV